MLEQIVNADNQLNELTFREAEISQLYKKDHPTYRALIEKRQTLEQEKNRLNKRVSSMPSTQQEVLRLSRDVESGRVIYQQLLNREQELSIARSSAIGNVRIIDPAVTRPQPVKPKKALVVVLGVLPGSVRLCGLDPRRAVCCVWALKRRSSWRSTGLTSMPPYRCQNGWLKRCVCVKKTLCPRGLRHKTKHIPFRRRIIRSISPWRRFAACAPACISR